MQLTRILLKVKASRGKPFQGNIWIGKHRIIHGVYPKNLECLTKKIQTEEQNLFYLRHPYLTSNQENGYAKELKKHEAWLNGRKLEDGVYNCKPSIKMEDRLGHLNVASTWEL